VVADVAPYFGHPEIDLPSSTTSIPCPTTYLTPTVILHLLRRASRNAVTSGVSCRPRVRHS
jgi:hypothetical protein